MKILVLNRGSSSVKCYLYELERIPDQPIAPLWERKIEWKNIGNADSIQQALVKMLAGQKIDCIGHRIVHGGKKYKTSVFINSEVKNDIRNLAELAPLHNLADLEGIEILEKLYPGIPQVAVFDTAFHHTLPKSAAIYPGPYEWVEKGIQRYGFHGTSFQYCSRRAQWLIREPVSKMVVCHLGSGASLCAISNGKSVDTTMGLTPLEGLMMDTRSGTVDPGILLYLLKKMTPDQLGKVLYEQSGLLGLSGVSSDMRDILEKGDQGNERAQLSIDVYVHRLASMIGSMAVSLGGIEALIFTAGIGENSSLIREKVCERLFFLGVHLSKQQNNQREDLLISSPDSKVKVLVIHTQEAFEIARECMQIDTL